jgi:hypothetical protein
MKRRLFHRLTAQVKLYFPGDRLVEIGSSLVADCLERWPSLKSFKRRGRLRSSASLSATTAGTRAHRTTAGADSESSPGNKDKAACSTAVIVWASLLRQLLNAIKSYHE